MLPYDPNTFWPEYWSQVDALVRKDASEKREEEKQDSDSGHLDNIKRNNSSSRMLLSKIRTLAAQQQSKHLSVAWAAHLLVTSLREVYCPTWTRQLACLALIQASYDEFPIPTLLELLIPDALDCLHQACCSPSADSEASAEEEDERGRMMLMELVESLLPHILGPDQYQRFHKELSAAPHSGKPPSEAAQAAISQAVAHWTTKAASNNCDLSTNRNNSNTQQSDAGDSSTAVVSPMVWATDDHDRDLLQEVTRVARLDDLLAPQPSVAPPFNTPLPPDLDVIMDEAATRHGGLDTASGTDNLDEFRTPEEQLLAQQQLAGELQWIAPTNLRLLLIPDDDDDDDMGVDGDGDRNNSEENQEMKTLFQKAFTKPLPPNEQRTFLGFLTDAASHVAARQMVLAGNTAKNAPTQVLTPDSLPRLVEHNPNVAHECLVHILGGGGQNNKDSKKDEKMATSADLQNEYLSRLVNMAVSLHSMEVVHRLATQTSPPLVHAEYVQLYINACLAACDTTATLATPTPAAATTRAATRSDAAGTDSSRGTATSSNPNLRLVRLVCVWIQSLLRNGIVEVDDVFWQVQAFCIEHSKVREASSLYKSLQTIQQQQKPIKN